MRQSFENVFSNYRNLYAKVKKVVRGKFFPDVFFLYRIK